MTTALAETQRRREKVDRLRAHGVDPFPHFTLRDRTLIAQLIEHHDPRHVTVAPAPAGPYNLAGRVVGRRKSGSATLLDLRDRSGTIRLRARPDASPSRAGPPDIGDWDLGDIVAVSGHLCVMGIGELVLELDSGWLLTKALQLHHGLSQPGHRSRRRELDLMSSAECRKRFATRAALIRAIREWLTRHDFIEVETPILQSLAGGALARPFLTHHNALGRELSLRVSAELYLRRCTVGDFERVYELGKCFRNEGTSPRHNPEFTMLEWSMAYSDYHDSASLAERLVTETAQQILGTLQTVDKGITIDLKTPWQRVTLQDAIKERTGLDILTATHEEILVALPTIPTDTEWSSAVNMLYGSCVEPHFTEPTIVYDFPLDAHPCVKRHGASPQLGESFDLVISGLEIGSGGTEVNDPDEQRSRFIEHGNRGDRHEPHPGDHEYATALEYGAPPSSGAGIGIDRLLMVLVDSASIRDVTLFPT